jgi:hypothetical protein
MRGIPMKQTLMLITSCRTKDYGMHILVQMHLWSEHEHVLQSCQTQNTEALDQGNWFLIHRLNPPIFNRCCIHRSPRPRRPRLFRQPHLLHLLQSCAGRISDGHIIGVVSSMTSPRARVVSTMKLEPFASRPSPVLTGKKYLVNRTRKDGVMNIGEVGMRHMV